MFRGRISRAMCLSNDHGETLSALKEETEHLAGIPVTHIKPVSGGRNNRVYRVRLTDGRCLALKKYFHSPEDPRDRLRTEFSTLRFLWENGINYVPEPVACDRESGIALYRWIEGEKVADPAAGDIDRVVDFLSALKRLAGCPAAASLRPASEACLCADELIAQVEARFERLSCVATDYPELERFLRERLQSRIHLVKERLLNGYADNGLSCSEDIEMAFRTLSPADFCFNDTLYSSDGILFFLDFEYFGWDDPVKMLSDFLLHPGMKISLELKERFLNGTFNVFSTDRYFPVRLKLQYPMYLLRWSLIILNEFLPEVWSRRSFAGAGASRAARNKQLDKAESFLRGVEHDDMAPFLQCL